MGAFVHQVLTYYIRFQNPMQAFFELLFLPTDFRLLKASKREAPLKMRYPRK